MTNEAKRREESVLTDRLYGRFEPDERYISLVNRLQQYYDDTPDSMNNRDAAPFWKNFIQWCDTHGYTREEINKAKLDCRFKNI